MPQVIEKMERETGFEPATSSLGSWHSTTELLPLAYVFRYLTASKGLNLPAASPFRLLRPSKTMRFEREMNSKTARESSIPKRRLTVHFAVHLMQSQT